MTPLDTISHKVDEFPSYDTVTLPKEWVRNLLAVTKAAQEVRAAIAALAPPAGDGTTTNEEPWWSLWVTLNTPLAALETV